MWFQLILQCQTQEHGLIPAFVFLLGKLDPVYLNPSLVWLVKAVLEITKIVGYHQCSSWVGHPGILLVLRAQLLEAAEIVLSHDTRRRRRDGSKHNLIVGYLGKLRKMYFLCLRTYIIDHNVLGKSLPLWCLLFLISLFYFLTKVVNWLILMKLVDRFDKKIRYASRKARADVRKRVKGRFIKAGEAYDYDPLSQTRSYWALNTTGYLPVSALQPSTAHLL